MITFAAVVPHSPLFHKGIGADVSASLKDAHTALEEVYEDLYATHPDTIVLISDHPIGYQEHVTVQVQDPIRFDLSEFGDFSLRSTISPDLQIIDDLQRHMRKEGHPITLDSVDALSFSAAIPLQPILAQLPSVRLVAISPPSKTSASDLYELAQDIKEVLSRSSRRVAILAAGDGSHALTDRSPHTPTKEGKEFDHYMEHILSNRNTSSLLNLDPELVKNAHQAMYEQVVMLFGCIRELQAETKLHGYYSPFGVGYFIASYQLI